MDLDNFKVVNDNFGHAAGDDLLVAVTNRLLGCVRGADTIARLGGDEFAVLLEDAASEAGAVEVAERMLGAVRRPLMLRDNDVGVSISVGISFSAPGVGATGLVADADLAMYAAKRRGRDRYEIFDAARHQVPSSGRPDVDD
jgi:diguanylate cyclase (GGDEF)-like protein